MRNVLRRLRRLRASDDFEVRFQRRIAAEESTEPGPGLSPRRIVVRRIPVLAYSLISIVVLGIVSYYLISHVLLISPPSEERRSGSEGGKIIAPQPSDSQSTGIQGVQKKRFPVDDIPVMKQAPPRVEEPPGVGARKEEKAAAKSIEAGRPVEPPGISEKAVSGKDPGSMRFAVPERSPEKEMLRSMAPMSNKGVMPVQPTFEAHPALGSAADSVARNDSVKLDSLRKDLKPRQKLPKKKPFE